MLVGVWQICCLHFYQQNLGVRHLLVVAVANMTDESQILLVEDNPLNQKVMLLLLEQLGLKAVVVSNGRQAVEAVSKDSFAVILMDIMMVGMDGFEASKAIRKIEALQNTYTPIIAVTAMDMVDDRSRCLSAGMDDYIPKPIEPSLLRIKLNHWLQKEVVQHNKQIIGKFAQLSQPVSHNGLIDLAELEEFYGTEQVQGVLQTFTSTTEKLLSDIKSCLADHKDYTLARLAHELKGSSASVGAKSLSKQALCLERAAVLRDWTDAAEIFSTLENTFHEIKRFIGQFVPNLA